MFSWYCEGYRIGDDLYIAGQEELGAIDLNTKEFRYCREEYVWAEEYAQKVIGEETYYMRTFRAILQQDDVTVYSAEIAEANDSPAVEEHILHHYRERTGRYIRQEQYWLLENSYLRFI